MAARHELLPDEIIFGEEQRAKYEVGLAQLKDIVDEQVIPALYWVGEKRLRREDIVPEVYYRSADEILAEEFIRGRVEPRIAVVIRWERGEEQYAIICDAMNGTHNSVTVRGGGMSSQPAELKLEDRDLLKHIGMAVDQMFSDPEGQLCIGE